MTKKMKDKSSVMHKKATELTFKEVLLMIKMRWTILIKTIKIQSSFIRNMTKIYRMILKIKNMKININIRFKNIRLRLKVMNCNNFTIINKFAKTL